MNTYVLWCEEVDTVVGYFECFFFEMFRRRQEEAMRIEREMQEAEELARIEAEAEAAALTEILNLDDALVCGTIQHSLNLYLNDNVIAILEYLVC